MIGRRFAGTSARERLKLVPSAMTGEREETAPSPACAPPAPPREMKERARSWAGQVVAPREERRGVHFADPKMSGRKTTTEMPATRLMRRARSTDGFRSPRMMRVIVEGVTPTSRAKVEALFPDFCR